MRSKGADEMVEEKSKMKKSSAVGNAAAMREALRYIIKQIDKNPERLSSGQLLCIIGDKAEAALSAPARNCDMFGGDFKMLHTAWFDWTGSPSGQNSDGTVKLMFDRWLLAPAAERKG